MSQFLIMLAKKFPSNKIETGLKQNPLKRMQREYADEERMRREFSMRKISNLPTKHTFGNLQNVKTEMTQLANSPTDRKTNTIFQKKLNSLMKKKEPEFLVKHEKEQPVSERTFQQLLHRSKSRKLPNFERIKMLQDKSGNQIEKESKMSDMQRKSKEVTLNLVSTDPNKHGPEIESLEFVNFEESNEFDRQQLMQFVKVNGNKSFEAENVKQFEHELFFEAPSLLEVNVSSYNCKKRSALSPIINRRTHKVETSLLDNFLELSEQKASCPVECREKEAGLQNSEQKNDLLKKISEKFEELNELLRMAECQREVDLSANKASLKNEFLRIYNLL